MMVYKCTIMNFEITVKYVHQMHFCEVSNFKEYGEKHFIQVAKNRGISRILFLPLSATRFLPDLEF